MTTEELKEIKVAKYLCQNSLLFHTRYFFKKQYSRRFVIGQHHQKICDALERILNGKSTRLIIEIAPRYGKTELAVKNFIAHALSLNPSSKFIHLSYSDTLALDNSESVKDLVQSEDYQKLFPEVQIKKDSKAKDKWYTTMGGGVLARASAGQVTGFGAGKVDDEDIEFDEFLDDMDVKKTFGGAIIIDDSIKPEDADQDTVREKVNSRFDSTIRNRVNSRNTPIIVIGQRLHPNDLPGYLQRDEEEDNWEVLSLPCLYTNAQGILEALWPFKHTVEELQLMEKANDVVFQRQYQQDPRPKKGLMFPLQELNFYDHAEMQDLLDDAEASYMAVDPANLGGDDFAGIVAKLIGNKIYITDAIYNTEGADINEPAVVNMILKEKITNAGVEGVFGWIESVKRIREELVKKGYEGEVRALRPRTGKHTRINTRSSFIRIHFYFRKDYMRLPEYMKFIKNLTAYLKIQTPGLMNKHDEAPDVCEMIAGYYEVNFAHVNWSVLK